LPFGGAKAADRIVHDHHLSRRAAAARNYATAR
jgi:hypothetical protein